MPSLALNPTTILAALLLIAISFGGCEYHQSAKHEADAIAAQQQVKSLLAVEKDKDAVIATYAQANAKLAEDAQAQRDANTKAAATADLLRQQLDDTLNQLQAKEKADHAKPDCQKLLQTSLAVCPAHLDSLRKLATGSVQGPR